MFLSPLTRPGTRCSPCAVESTGPYTCSSPPAWGAAHHAEGDGHEAIAAVPEPGAAAQLTVHAWPGADVLLTWVQRESPAGLCRVQLQPKMKQRRDKAILIAPSLPVAPYLRQNSCTSLPSPTMCRSCSSQVLFNRPQFGSVTPHVHPALGALLMPFRGAQQTPCEHPYQKAGGAALHSRAEGEAGGG